MPFPNSNLSSSAQPWARDVQKRIEGLEKNVKANEINNTARDVQLDNNYKRLDKAVNDLIVADAAIQIAVAQAQQAADDAQAAIDAVGNLDQPTSTYKINADNVTVGTLSGITLIGNTIKSAASGTRVEISGTNTDFYNSTGYVGRINGGTLLGGNELAMMNYNGTRAVYVDATTASLYGSGASMGVNSQSASIFTSRNVTVDFGGLFDGMTYHSGGFIINKAVNISGNSSSLQGVLVLNDSSYYMKFDGNEISSYTSGGSGANLYLNGSGSSGAVILGDGGGATSVRNVLNAQGGLVVSGGGITSSGIYSNLITGRDMFITSAGVMGYATSSRKYKRDIEDLQLNADAILSIKPVSFRYNIGVLKEENGNDPDELQWGFIAEDLVDAGLTGIVDYDPETGDVEGIKYGRFVIALQSVVREQANQIKSLSDRITILENK